MQIFNQLTEQEGRIALTLQLARLGHDLICVLSGGQAHLGATAVASPSLESLDQVWCCQLPGHREGEIAVQLAFDLAHSYQCQVQTSVGIHFVKISQAEIATVYRLVASLTAKVVAMVEKKAES